MSIDKEEAVIRSAKLKQLQCLDLNSKIKLAEKRIRDWHEMNDGNVCVSFSGGKDSTVLLHLVRSIFPDVPAVFCNTGLEYPEVVRHVHTIDNVTIIRPEMTYKEVLEKYGYPLVTKSIANKIEQYRNTKSKKVRQNLLNKNLSMYYISAKWQRLIESDLKISAKCCDIMKKKPLKKYQKEHGLLPFVGTMAYESKHREQAWILKGCNIAGYRSAPLSVWNEQDILKYIYIHKLPIPKVYGEVIQNEKGEFQTTGCRRTGCVFCMFGVHLEPHPNRFEQLRETHPKLYEYCMKELRLDIPLREVGIEMNDLFNPITFDLED